MVAASQLRLMRSKSESAAREMVNGQKVDANSSSILKAYKGFAAERLTAASPCPPPVDMTKSGENSKGVVGAGLLRKISSSGSKTKNAKSSKPNGSDKNEASKNDTSDDDDISIISKSSAASSKRGGMGRLLHKMSCSGSTSSAALAGNNDEARDEKVVKTSSATEDRDLSSDNEDLTLHYELEQKNQPPPESGAGEMNNLRYSTMQMVQRLESDIEESKIRVTKDTIKRSVTTTPPLPVQTPSTSSTYINKKPKQSKIPLHPWSSRSSTPEIKCEKETPILGAGNSNISNKEGSTSEPESSTIVRSSSGQSTKSQTPKTKHTTSSKVPSTRDVLPPRSSDNNLKAGSKSALSMPTRTNRSGLESAAVSGGASIRRSVSGWSKKPISSSEIKRCSSECSSGNRFVFKQLPRGGSWIQNKIITKKSNTDERKTNENESTLKPGGSVEWTDSEVVTSKNISNSLQSISFESNHNSLIKVTHSKASIIKINSSEMMAFNSFSLSPKEELSMELGIEIVRSMDGDKPILCAESAVANSTSSSGDEQREDEQNDGHFREYLCISTNEVCTPSSGGINGLVADMQKYTFGYGYSLYVKSLEIYHRELELKKTEEKKNENREAEAYREGTHDEQEEKLAEVKQNAEGDKVQEEDQPQSSDADALDGATTTTGSKHIVSIVETTKNKQLPESAKPTVRDATTSTSFDEEDKNKEATTMFCGHPLNELSLLHIFTIIETTKIKQFSEHIATCIVSAANECVEPTVLEDPPRRLVEEDKNENAKSAFGGYQWKQLMKWCARFHA